MGFKQRSPSFHSPGITMAEYVSDRHSIHVATSDAILNSSRLIGAHKKTHLNFVLPRTPYRN